MDVGCEIREFRRRGPGYLRPEDRTRQADYHAPSAQFNLHNLAGKQGDDNIKTHAPAD